MAAEIEFTVRPFDVGADIPRLAALLTAVAGAAPVSEEAVRATLAWPGHDPARDRWLVEEPGQAGRVIAHALVWKGPHDAVAEVSVGVHPAWRRQGLGNLVLTAALRRARQAGAAAARAYAEEHDMAATMFLQRRGFVPVAAYTELELAAGRAVAEPRFPPGYAVRAYAEVNDVPLLARTMTAAYEGLWGHHVVAPGELAAWLPDLDPEGIFLLFDAAADAVGLCRAAPAEAASAQGTVDAPGVIPERRDEGLHVPLLLAAVRWLRARGAGVIRLESWGDERRTLAQYEALGFVTARRETSYRLVLS